MMKYRNEICPTDPRYTPKAAIDGELQYIPKKRFKDARVPAGYSPYCIDNTQLQYGAEAG